VLGVSAVFSDHRKHSCGTIDAKRPLSRRAIALFCREVGRVTAAA
jgi:hypothetical protein